MYRKIWVITWCGKNGTLHDLTYNTMEEAEAWADKLMDREERDGIRRDWIIRSYYARGNEHDD